METRMLHGRTIMSKGLFIGCHFIVQTSMVTPSYFKKITLSNNNKIKNKCWLIHVFKISSSKFNYFFKLTDRQT